jgi:DNA-binding transcriptional MerR regulator
VAGPKGKDPQAPDPERAARAPTRPSASGRLADALRRALDDPEETTRGPAPPTRSPAPQTPPDAPRTELPARPEPAPRAEPPPAQRVEPVRPEPSPALPLPAGLDLVDGPDESDDGEEIVDEALVDSPDKLYFRIGEVAQLVGVDAHVLRYWESEFRMKPRRSPSGQRLYRRSDLAKFLRIKSLLHDEGYTIAGARKVLTGTLGAPTVDPSRLKAALERVRVLRRLIREIQDELDLDNQT